MVDRNEGDLTYEEDRSQRIDLEFGLERVHEPNVFVPGEQYVEMVEAVHDAYPDGETETPSTQRGWFVQMLRVFAQNKVAVVFVVLLIAITLFCFCGPWFYHTN